MLNTKEACWISGSSSSTITQRIQLDQNLAYHITINHRCLGLPQEHNYKAHRQGISTNISVVEHVTGTPVATYVQG